MRRPLKPFVTEYKNPTRRPKDAFDMPSGISEVQPEVDHDAPPRPFMPADDSSYEAAVRAADALFSGGSTPQATLSDPVAEAVRHAPERPAGRILQAIDETPIDRFAELEAAHAPRRRGRKPGSKNKPKLATALTGAAPLPIPSVVAPLRPIKPVATAPRPRAAAPVRTAPAVRKEPYPWVRTRLRPGEKWKLRLPKVTW